MIRKRLAAWICAGVAFWTSSALAEGYGPLVGEFHPDFVLPSLVDRTPISLSQCRGRKVLLIHFASW